MTYLLHAVYTIFVEVKIKMKGERLMNKDKVKELAEEIKNDAEEICRDCLDGECGRCPIYSFGWLSKAILRELEKD